MSGKSNKRGNAGKDAEGFVRLPKGRDAVQVGSHDEAGRGKC